jgi:NAD(P)-dependent dehydrogenase (short-subunit alcohol dehydrogenase family)
MHQFTFLFLFLRNTTMSTSIALVTGGNRGLGKDMVQALAHKGMDIILTYNTNAEQAEQVVGEIIALGRRAVAVQFDAGKPSAIDAVVAHVKTVLDTWGTSGLSALVNNAGIGATLPFATVTEEQFDSFLNIHLKSVYFLTQKLLPHLSDGSSIVNISTGTTRFCVPGYSVYASMKGGVEVFTKYLAKELGARGIRANVVAPGPVETDFNSAAIRSNPQMKGFLAGLSPLGRVGQADDIGSVVAFLCSADAKWINGQRIEVSGGINI